MKTCRECAVFLGVMGLFGIAHGYPRAHGPFQNGKAPLSVRLAECTVVKSQYAPGDRADCPSILFFIAPNVPKRTTLKLERLIDTNCFCWRITVLDGEGRPISIPATNDMPSYGYSVRSADFNQDG